MCTFEHTKRTPELSTGGACFSLPQSHNGPGDRGCSFLIIAHPYSWRWPGAPSTCTLKARRQRATRFVGPLEQALAVLTT